jgi:hypothetical protein
MKVVLPYEKKQYGCDGCPAMTEVLRKLQHLPYGWVKVMQKVPGGYWEGKFLFCPDCAEKVLGALEQLRWK